MTEVTRPAMPKLFIVWFFTEKSLLTLDLEFIMKNINLTVRSKRN